MVNTDLLLIDTDSALTKLCGDLEDASWLALDTEFERVNTYYPELCLLQVCNGEITALVDPLKINSMELLFSLLYDKNITKVFHAARQDLELFFHLRREIPVPLFDTQIAAGFLGYESQVGYANLIKEVLGVELAKAETRTDWKRRPLSLNQQLYAADDVIYLAKMYEQFLPRLSGAKELALMEVQLLALTQPELYEPDPNTMWQKIKIAKKLKDEPLEILKKLAAWREITARKENRPRKWILGDHALVAMANTPPENLQALSKVSGVNSAIIKHHGEALLAILN